MFCPVLLAVVLAIAAFTKARNRFAFERFVQSLPYFGVPRAAPLAATVIVAEAGVAGLVVVAPRLGCALAACLFLAFTAGIGVALRRGQPVVCRCFGASAATMGVQHLVRNGLLVIVAVVGMIWPAWSSVLSVQFLSGALGAFAGYLVTRWDDLVFIARGPSRT